MTDSINDPDLVEHLDDETLRLAREAASADEQCVLLAELERRGLEV